MTHSDPVVLVVEDEAPMRRFLRASLASHRYRVIEASTASAAMNAAMSQHPDFILMDLGLPDGDGIELTKRLREWSRIPIIVVSARGREDDKVEALDAGADDYLTKPFGTNELLARMRVATRHMMSVGAADAVLDFGPVRIDLARRQVTRDAQEVHLTPTEYHLLTFLALNAGRVLSHRQILTEVWGPAFASQTQYVRVHMAELRKKLEVDPARPSLLQTEPGVGYRLRG